MVHSEELQKRGWKLLDPKLPGIYFHPLDSESSQDKSGAGADELQELFEEYLAGRFEFPAAGQPPTSSKI